MMECKFCNSNIYVNKDIFGNDVCSNCLWNDDSLYSKYYNEYIKNKIYIDDNKSIFDDIIF